MNRLFLKRKISQRLLLASALMAWSIARAGDIKYPVSAISGNLKNNADVVKRMEETVVEIVSAKESRLHYKYALTILNESGNQYAGFSEWYDKLRRISSVEGNLYDARGVLIKKMKRKDIADFSAVEEGLADDNRVKQYDFFYRKYPYTVEFEVKIKVNHTFYFPVWLPQDHVNLSVQQSKFTVIVPVDYMLRYKSFNYKGEPARTEQKEKKLYVWSVENIPAIEQQLYSPEWNEITTSVNIAPTEFEVQGIKGNMNSWKDFGKFIYKLKQGRDVLPDGAKQKAFQLVADAHNDLEKVQRLYSFLQQSTRYVSIQLGIGGWQPFDAAYVFKKGYGDCKALSNYMYSLLKSVGIKSYYALVKAGNYDHGLMEDFPSNQFNHVILCVPLQKDTVWLECTSQTIAPGYLGEFTANRKALLIDEDGGILVSTPRYRLKENVLARQIKSKLDTEGTLDMKVVTSYGGIQQDVRSMMAHSLSKDNIGKILQNQLDLGSYKINDFKYHEDNTQLLPELKEELDIIVSNYALISGRRLFIAPNILNRSRDHFTADDRVTDIVFTSEWKDVDIYEIEIPSGYEPEVMPPDVSLQTKFGTYTCSTKLNGNKIIYQRTRVQFAGRFLAKDGVELTKFFEEMSKADRSRVVLVKKPE